jgi:hypothetical protein
MSHIHIMDGNLLRFEVSITVAIHLKLRHFSNTYAKDTKRILFLTWAVPYPIIENRGDTNDVINLV